MLISMPQVTSSISGVDHAIAIPPFLVCFKRTTPDAHTQEVFENKSIIRNRHVDRALAGLTFSPMIRTPKFRVAKCALVILFSLILGAHAVFSGELSEAEPFDGYNEACGYPILFTPTLAVSEAVIDRNGQLRIILDPLLAAGEERDRMQFLVAHECAHHAMGHALPASRRARALSNRTVRDQELSADCWAAELLARLGNERPVLVMTQRFHRSGLYSPGGGYPAGIQRASIINQCALNGRKLRLVLRQGADLPQSD